LGAAAAGIQPKHWASQLRRSDLFDLLVSAFALAADDMAQVVLWPSRFARSLGNVSATPAVLSEHAVKLQPLGTALVKSLAAVLRAEVEAFQHLPKDQQVRAWQRYRNAC